VTVRAPWVVALVVLVDAAVLEPLGVRWLPADRVVDGAWLTLVLAAGVGAARVLERAARGSSARAAGLSLAAVALAAGVSMAGDTLSLWPRGSWPSLAATARGLRLDDLWASLRAAPPGRVLFVRSGVPLVYGTEWYRPHTHITALAPLAAGRAIVNGTFTHPSPVAALVYRGSAGAGAITRLVEQLDGHTLFGRPLDALGADTLEALADPLGVSVVVGLDEDAPRLHALRDDAVFRRLPAPPAFIVAARRHPVTLPEPVADGRWRLPVAGAPGEWVPVRMAFYPLWSATQAGVPLETRRGPHADLEVRLASAAAPLDLEYAPAAAEWAGLAVTAAALCTCLAVLPGRRRAPPTA
jgi:hypothetical protein